MEIDTPLLWCTACSVYTVPVQVGSNNQSFDLQVDMGSADLVRTAVDIFAGRKADVHVI